MLRCIRLAEGGRGSVSPNPMVGCVIVKDGAVIGEGFHGKFGEAHAEVNAFNSAKEDVAGSDVYVNLEPCSFFGKTPPCTDLLIRKRVRKVYVGMLDPNPKVNGKGVQKLKDAGIEVEAGILEQEARRLNEAFEKFVTKKLPFVALKVAQSLDGKIALLNGKSKYITSHEALVRVHELRSQYDAVLVGAGTVRGDNPELTVRYAEGRSPVRIVLDGALSSSVDSKVFREGRSIVFYSTAVAKNSRVLRSKLQKLEKKGVETYPLRGSSKGRLSIAILMKKIAELGIASVMIEGGAEVFSQFVRSGMADKLHLFVAPKLLGRGKSLADGMELGNLSESIGIDNIAVERYGVDYLFTGYFK
jgi:diaminohydroxyphosphoribosylaminopyrimidine deaminase/5-amino-6-(5-phosphoribosylamino)uracil reductase